MDYFNYINELRDQFYKEHGRYPSYLVISPSNKIVLFEQMKSAGIPPRANPMGSHYFFMGAKILEGDIEGFF
ncbi:hypothetical protein NLX66_003665 [Acinetobacter baumannii]|nr:hypothetical protein [Acinetobacter baumannii]